MTRNPEKRVLVCPLGWGLGHASRLIPVIRKLQELDFEVIIAGDQFQLDYIVDFFPGIDRVLFPSIKVKLSPRSNQLFRLIWIAIRLPIITIKEHHQLKELIRKYKVDIVISDNRYGLWNKGIKSVFITHQLKVFFPKPFRLFEPIGELHIRWMIKKFDYCWIPDSSDSTNLSGGLSHKSRIDKHYRFIGILSRFRDSKSESFAKQWDLVGISSGPPPQREIFIDLLTTFGKTRKLRTLIVKGNANEGRTIKEQDGIFFVGHLNDAEFAEALLSSKYIITRSGYSTIMDLVAIGINGLIVPTPGQTEQEYLAKYLSKKLLFNTCHQSELLNIEISLALTENISFYTHPNTLETYIHEVFKH